MKQDCDEVTNLWISLKQRLKEKHLIRFLLRLYFLYPDWVKPFCCRRQTHCDYSNIRSRVQLFGVCFVSELWFDLMSAADWCDDEQIDLSSTNFFNSFTWFCVVGGLCGVEVTCCWLRGKLPPGNNKVYLDFDLVLQQQNDECVWSCLRESPWWVQMWTN